jgi:hypothetical protein
MRQVITRHIHRILFDGQRVADGSIDINGTGAKKFVCADIITAGGGGIALHSVIVRGNFTNKEGVLRFAARRSKLAGIAKAQRGAPLLIRERKSGGAVAPINSAEQ